MTGGGRRVSGNSSSSQQLGTVHHMLNAEALLGSHAKHMHTPTTTLTINVRYHYLGVPSAKQ